MPLSAATLAITSSSQHRSRQYSLRHCSSSVRTFWNQNRLRRYADNFKYIGSASMPLPFDGLLFQLSTLQHHYCVLEYAAEKNTIMVKIALAERLGVSGRPRKCICLGDCKLQGGKGAQPNKARRRFHALGLPATCGTHVRRFYILDNIFVIRCNRRKCTR